MCCLIILMLKFIVWSENTSLKFFVRPTIKAHLQHSSYTRSGSRGLASNAPFPESQKLLESEEISSSIYEWTTKAQFCTKTTTPFENCSQKQPLRWKILHRNSHSAGKLFTETTTPLENSAQKQPQPLRLQMKIEFENCYKHVEIIS